MMNKFDEIILQEMLTIITVSCHEEILTFLLKF